MVAEKKKRVMSKNVTFCAKGMAVVVNFLALGVKRREPWFLAVLPACVEIPLVRIKRAKVKLMVTSDTMKIWAKQG